MCRGRRLSEHIFVSIRGCRAKGDYSANTVFSCLVRTEHGLRNARNRGLAWLVTAVLRIEVCESDVEQFRARAEAFLNDARSSRGACAWNAIVVLGILVSIGATFLETIVNVSEPENDQYSFVNRNVKRWQENVVDTFFLCELFARFSACESVFAPPDATLAPVALKTAWSKSPASRRQKKIPFALDVLNYLDLVAVLPLMMRVLARGFYNHQMSSFGLQWINMVKLLRAFKMMRSYTAAEVLVQTVQRTAVPLLLPGCLLLLMAVFFGSVVFMFEPCYNYDTCQFQSLWTAMYYGLVTMTTVGYGDQVPGNGWARATTVLMMLVGTFFLSMPLAIIGAEFDRAYNRKVRGKAVEARARELLKDWLEEMYPNFREHLTARQDAPSLVRASSLLVQGNRRRSQRSHISIVAQDVEDDEYGENTFNERSSREQLDFDERRSSHRVSRSERLLAQRKPNTLAIRRAIQGPKLLSVSQNRFGLMDEYIQLGDKLCNTDELCATVRDFIQMMRQEPVSNSSEKSSPSPPAAKGIAFKSPNPMGTEAAGLSTTTAEAEVLLHVGCLRSALANWGTAIPRNRAADTFARMSGFSSPEFQDGGGTEEDLENNSVDEDDEYENSQKGTSWRTHHERQKKKRSGRMNSLDLKRLTRETRSASPRRRERLKKSQSLLLARSTELLLERCRSCEMVLWRFLWRINDAQTIHKIGTMELVDQLIRGVDSQAQSASSGSSQLAELSSSDRRHRLSHHEMQKYKVQVQLMYGGGRDNDNNSTGVNLMAYAAEGTAAKRARIRISAARVSKRRRRGHLTVVFERLVAGVRALFGASTTISASSSRWVKVSEAGAAVSTRAHAPSWRRKLYYVLEVPKSSWCATVFHYVLLILIMASSGAYLCESMPSLMRYGENSEHCREVVRDYCSIRASRRDPVRDPGCFTVLNVSDAGVYTIDPSKRIKFNLRGPDCDNRDDCFRSGYNFGNIGRNPRALTCKRPLSNDDFRRKPTATALPFVESSSSRSAAATRRGLVQFRGDDRRPFRVQSELPSLRWFTGVRYMLNPNAIYDICWRPECNSGHEMDYDFEDDWLYMETGIAVLSASEIVMRLIAIHPDPHYKATADAYFWTDVASLVPYFAEIGVPLFDRGAKIDFTLGPKERWWMFLFKSLKLFRFFKIARHMDGWSVVVETILKIRQKLLIPLFFLFLINLIAAMLVYNFEFEKVCRYGVDCGTLADGVPSYPNGTRIATNIYDQVASLSSALDGFWLSLVTMTSVGFGRITPTTAAGRCVMVFAMIFGQFYLAMPLTIVGSQFYKLWLKRHTTLTEAIRIAGSQDRSQTLRKPIVLSKGLRDDVAALKGLTLAFSKSLDNLESVAFSRSRSDVSVLQLPSGGEPVPTVEEQDLAQVAANLATLLLFHPRLSRLVRNVVNQLRKVEHMKRRTAHSFEVPEVVGDGASALRDSFCSTVPEY